MSSSLRRNSCCNECRYVNGKLQVCCGCLPARWMLGVMAFFGTFTVFSSRVNLSAAIVAMVDYEGLNRLHQANVSVSSTTPSSNTTSKLPGRCGDYLSHGNAETTNTTSKLFLWDENMQGLALASYFYGYGCAQILGAWIGRRLGRVRVWGFCILLASLITMLLPATLDIGYGAFIAARITIGFFSGVSYPIMHGMWSMWAPPSERGKLLVLQFAGAPVGSFVIFPLSGVLAKEFGWQSVFYFTGAIGTLWAILWWFLMHDTPADHPRISDKEKQFIESSLGHNTPQNEAKSQQTRSVPWFSLLTSVRLWSTVIPHFATNFATYIFLTLLPTYLRTVLNFDVKSSGILSSIPYIVKMCLFPIAGWSADWVISKGVKTIHIRKIWTSISTFLPGIALAVAAYTGCNVGLIMFLFTIPDALDTFSIPGFKASMIEIAPPFAGVIFAVANTIATASGFLAPQIAGALREAHRHDPIKGWRSLFWLGSVIYFIGGLAFVTFGSSDVQKWAAQPQTEMVMNEEEMLVKNKNEVEEQNI